MVMLPRQPFRQTRAHKGHRKLFRAGFCLAVLSLACIQAVADTGNNHRRIVLIGATAASAGDLIEQALEAGHEVIGVTRRPESMELQHERFTAVYGDVYKIDTIAAVLTGDEVVISYIDINFPFGPEIPAGVDLFSRGTSNIIEAMKLKGNRRLFVTSNMAAEYVVLDKPGPGAQFRDLMGWNRRHKYADARLMETIVEGSELDYTILRMPHLVPGEPTGEVNIVVGKNAYNTAVKNQTPPRTLTVADLSAFILEQMNSDEYVEARVGIYN
jgi:putative NADH-flavin reductase